MKKYQRGVFEILWLYDILNKRLIVRSDSSGVCVKTVEAKMAGERSKYHQSVKKGRLFKWKCFLSLDFIKK